MKPQRVGQPKPRSVSSPASLVAEKARVHVVNVTGQGSGYVRTAMAPVNGYAMNATGQAGPGVSGAREPAKNLNGIVVTKYSGSQVGFRVQSVRDVTERPRFPANRAVASPSVYVTRAVGHPSSHAGSAVERKWLLARNALLRGG